MLCCCFLAFFNRAKYAHLPAFDWPWYRRHYSNELYYSTIFQLQKNINTLSFILSIIKEIKRILRSINDKAHASENQTNEIKMLLSEYIDAHSAIKQLSIFQSDHFYFCTWLIDFQLFVVCRVVQNCSDIFQPIVMTLFTWALLSISCALLNIQMGIVEYPPTLANRTFFEKYYRFVSDASRKPYSFVGADYKRHFRINLCVYRMWAGPKIERCLRWNWFHSRIFGLVFTSNRNKTNFTVDSWDCTATCLTGMLWQHPLYANCV